ncbi:hypothetical protein [Nostoc sp. DSM 114160]
MVLQFVSDRTGAFEPRSCTFELKMAIQCLRRATPTHFIDCTIWCVEGDRS